MTTTHTSPGSGTERIKLFDHYPPSDDIDAISEWHAQRLILLMQYTNESRKLLERHQGTTDHMMTMINERDRNTNKKAWKRKKACSHNKSRSSSSRSGSRSRSKKRRSHSRSPRSHTHTHSDAHIRRTREIHNGVDTRTNALSSEVVAKTVPGQNVYHNEYLNMDMNMNGMNHFHHHQQHPYQDEYHEYKHKHDHENENEHENRNEGNGGGISEDADAGACAGTGTGTGAVMQFEFPTNHDHDLFLMRELKGTSLSSSRNCDKPTCTFTRTRGISEPFTSTSSTSAMISPSIKTKPILVPKATTDRDINTRPHIYNSSDAPLYGQSFSLDSYDGTTNANTNANTNAYFEESRMHKVASSPGSSRSRPGSACTSTGNGTGAGTGTTLDAHSDSFSNKYGLQHHLPYHQSSSYMNMKMNI